MKKIFLGKNNLMILEKENLPKRDFVLLHDEIPALPHAKAARIFDPTIHHFNAIQPGYHYACDFVDAIDALFPAGGPTLTKEEGLIFILDQLLDEPKSLRSLIPKPNSKSTPGHRWAYSKVQRLLLSPVLNRVLCEPGEQFSFNPHSVIFCRINRRELRDFDTLALGLLIMMRSKGQLVITDMGFYGRNNHISLLDRLIGSLTYLDELKRTAPELKEALFSLTEIEAHGARFTDAKELAINEGLRPDPTRADNEYNNFIDAAMA